MNDSQPGHWNKSFERVFAFLFVLIGLLFLLLGIPFVIAISYPLVLLAVVVLALAFVGWGCYALYRSFING